MCSTIEHGDKDITNGTQLAALVGVQNIIFNQEDVPLEDCCCLCPIDVSATLAKAGIEAEFDYATWRIKQ